MKLITSVVLGSALLWTSNLLGQDAPLPPVVERYEQMLVRSPSKGTAFEKVYQHFFEGEGIEKLAERWVHLAEAGGPNAANYWLLHSLLCDRLGRNDEAIVYCERAARLRPDDFHAWMALGDLQAGAGKFAPAVEAYQKALAAGAPSDARPKIYRQLARSQQRNFDVSGAIQTWQKFVAEAPDDPFVLEEAGEALADAERFAEARVLFEKLRDRPDGDAYQRVRAIMKLAQLEEQQGHAMPARALYESALPLAADASWMHREVRGRIEELFRRQDDLPGLTKYYTSWMEQHPKDVEAALRLSDVLIELNKKKDAVEWLRRAAEWAPDRQEVQVMLAKRLGETGQPEEAVTILTRLVQLRPEEDSYTELLGESQWLVFEKTKDAASRTAAMESWKKLAPANEKDPARVGHVGDLLRGHQQADPAIEQYRRAITLAPTLNDLRERLAEYLFDLGRDAEAWVELDALGRVENPDFLRLARLEARHGANAAALASVQQGLAKDPKNFDLLGLEWQMLAEEKRWPEVLALFDALTEAAPNAYFLDDLEARYLMALEAAGKAEEFHKEREAQLGAGTLSERDLRLLARQLLNAGQLEILRKTLDEGRARFPNSFPLARIEVEYARRNQDLDARVLALRRLIELQPKLKDDFLHDIVAAYREASRWDEASAAVGELMAASPAKADGRVLLAEILLAAGQTDDAVNVLRSAVRLSDNPNSLRLRLSRIFLDSGELRKAREVLDEAFEAADKPSDRLALMPQLTEAYFLDSKLDTLIERFRQRQRGEDEGWRYALYLAEIYKQTLDFGAARRELARALAARPRDSGMLRQMVRLATDEQNRAETVRYQELLTETEPSDSNQVALVEAFLQNNQPEPAFAVLQRQFPAMNKVPGTWDRLMPLLSRQGLLDRLGQFVADQPGAKGNLELRLQLAVIQVALGNTPAATQSLWTIFDAPSAVPLPEPPEKPATASATTVSTYRMTPFEQRLVTSYQTRQVVDRVLNPSNYSPMYSVSGGVTPGKVAPTDVARDTALLYLAALSVRDNRAAQFLQELDAHLATRENPQKERLLAYSIVQAKESLLQEIRKQAHSNTPDEQLDGLCLNQLSMLIQNNRYEQDKLAMNKDEILELYTLLRDRTAKASKYPAGALQESDLYIYAALGLKEKAQELRQKVLATIDLSKPESVVNGIILAAQLGNLARVKELCATLAEVVRKNPTVAVAQLVTFLPVTISSNNGEPSTVAPEVRTEIIAEVLKIWYPPNVPRMGLGSLSTVRYWQGQNALPQSRYFDLRRINALANLAMQFDSMAGSRMDGAKPGDLPLLRQRLEEQARTLPEAQRIFPRLIPIYFDAWAGENEKALAALQPLLAEQPQDDDLRLLAATLLSRVKKYRESMEMLAQIPPRLGIANVDFQKLLLASAKLAGDDETARKAALRLTTLQLSTQERVSLTADLRALGLNERADLLAKQTSTVSTSGGGNASYQNYQELQRLVKERKETEALVLARQMLAGDPLVLVQNHYLATQAMSAFQTFGRLDAFVAETETALAQTPDSLRLNYLLAVAAQTHEAPRGTVRNGPVVKLPCWLKLAREDRSMVASLSPDGTTWTEVGRVTLPWSKDISAGLVLAGKEKDLMTSADFTGVSLVSAVPADPTAGSNDGGLPAPWTAESIGRVQAPGRTSFADGVYKLQAGGGWIGYEADALHFVGRPLAGDGTLITQVKAVDLGKGFGEAGIMFRESEDPKSSTVSLVVVPDQPIRFKYRLADGSTEKAWRRVIALRPDERRFQQQLAELLKNANRTPEALAIYEGIFAKSPDALMELAYEAGPLFKDAKRLDEFVDKVVAWQPPAKNNRDWSYAFDNVSEMLEKEKRPDLVEKVCRRGIGLATYNDAMTLRKRLAKALQGQGRNDEVLDVLANYFLPPAAALPDASTVSLGFQSNRAVDTRPPWQRSLSISDTQIHVSGLAMLDTAQELGVLPALATRINEAPVPEQSPLATRTLKACVKLKLRDPAAIEEVRACLKENSRRDNLIDTALLEAAREFKNWPGQESVALELFHALRPRVEADSFLSYGRNSFLIELARVEEQLADPAWPETLRALAATIVEDSVLRGGQNRREFRWRDAEVCLSLMLRAGLESDYTAFLEKMKKIPEGKSIAWNLEEEVKVFRGEGKPQVMAWLNDPLAGAPPASAEVAYEMRSEHPYDHADFFVFLASRLRSIHGLEKERTLRFLYGRSRETMAPIGDLTATAARGVWPGQVPEGPGWMRIALVENGAETPSPAVAVFRAPNLITNPGFEGLLNRSATAAQFDLSGWSKLPAGFWRINPGGPRGDGSVEFDGKETQKEILLTGQRIALEKGKIYQQSAWLRAISTMDHSVDWGRRYLAADGKVLKTTYCPAWFGYNWRWHSQRLAFETQPETEQIPAEAAFLEPVLKVKGGAEWSGLFVGGAEPPQ